MDNTQLNEPMLNEIDKGINDIDKGLNELDMGLDSLNMEEQSTSPKDSLNAITYRFTLYEYGRRLGKHLTAYGDRLKMDKLEKMTENELLELLNHVKSSVGRRGYSSQIEKGIDQVLLGMELFGPKIGLDITGFHSILSKNEEFQDCVSEVALEYSDMEPQDPLLKMLYSILTTIGTLNKVNKMKKIEQNVVKKVDEKMQNEFNNI